MTIMDIEKMEGRADLLAKQRPTYPLLLPPPPPHAPHISPHKQRLFKRRTKSALQLTQRSKVKTAGPQQGSSATLSPAMPGSSTNQCTDSPSNEEQAETVTPPLSASGSQLGTITSGRVRGGPGRISIFFGKVLYF